MDTEAAKLKIVETITLHKYDGEPPAEGEHKEPVETITLVYENGVLQSRVDEVEGDLKDGIN